MSICIYSPNTSDFSTNGLGILTPVECTVSKQAAGMWQLKLVQPIDNTFRWAQLQAGFLIKAPCPVRESPEIVEEIFPEGSTETTITQELYEVVKTSVGVRLRTGPGTKYKTIGIKRNGDLVAKLGMSGSSWMKVCTVDGGQTGYMSTKYLAPYETKVETTVSKVTGNQVIVPAQSREQLFRIDAVETDTEGGIVTATASHVSYEWIGNLLDAEYAPENDDVQNAITKLKNGLLMETEVELYAGGISGKITGDYSYKNPVEILFDPDEGIVAQTGAQVMRDNYNIYLYPDAVRDRNVTIRRGKNLIGVKVNTSDSGVVTRIIPCGRNKDGDPLYLDGQKYIDSERIGDYPTIRAQRIEYDVEVGEEFKNDAAVREELRKRVKADFESGIDLPSYGMEVNFVMLRGEGEYANYASLQAVHLYDTVTVIDEMINVNAKLRVTAYEWDVLSEQYNSVTLGDLQALQSTVYGYQIPSQSISGNKIINNSVSGNVFRDASIQYAKIAIAAIEQLNANSITAITGKFQEIATGKLTTNELYASVADIFRLAVENVEAGNIETDKLAAVVADIGTASLSTAKINYAQIVDAYAQRIFTDSLNAGKIRAENLEIDQAQIVDLIVGAFRLVSQDGKVYKVTIDAAGNLCTEYLYDQDAWLEDGKIPEGYSSVAGSLTVGDVTAGNLYVSGAAEVMKLTAKWLSADQAWIQDLTAGLIQSKLGERLNIQSNEAIVSLAGDVNSVATQLEQTADAFELSLSKKVDEDVLRQYLRYEDGTVEMGSSESRYKLQASNTGVVILQDGNPMTRMEQNTVAAPVFEAGRMLKIGEHTAKVSASGALVFN